MSIAEPFQINVSDDLLNWVNDRVKTARTMLQSQETGLVIANSQTPPHVTFSYQKKEVSTSNKERDENKTSPVTRKQQLIDAQKESDCKLAIFLAVKSSVPEVRSKSH
ncbi:hypothetical protein K435DRAFT_807557 [Dendrothele bispora CBS 962.96]|uniref:Uncharacterized protein n=1 Tax=Dendrothele bispora (strain CBS 962.96) TaxID=1314807 RepID=A0A4S8L4X3_DENBC|nr:hypothetical protein K435DRAFT_807557 [Dendrothele bispora CBS 962.96]